MSAIDTCHHTPTKSDQTKIRHENHVTNGHPGFVITLTIFAIFTLGLALYLTITEAPFAIKHDMAEAYAWGQEFQLGYNQHPPFWAWVCGVWFLLFPRTGWAFALLSSLNAAIGLWGAWMLIGNFAEGRQRVVAWLLLLATPLYTFYAYRYDANTIFLSIWPWALHYFMKSIKDREPGHAVMLGVLIGLALMSKYYALILVSTLFMSALLHPARRQYFRSSAPYIATLVAAVICTPHIVWSLVHRAPPLRYLSQISGREWHDVVANLTTAVLGVIGMNSGAVLIVAVMALATKRHAHIEAAESPSARYRSVLATMALAPLGMTIASALVIRNRITAEMTIGTFALVPLLVMELIGVRDLDRLYKISTRLIMTLLLGALVLSPGIAWKRTYLSFGHKKVAPFQEIALEATKIWRDRTSLPLKAIAGSAWYDTTIAFYSPDRPSVFVRFDYFQNLWMTPEHIARYGILSVCIQDDAVCLAQTANLSTPRTTRAETSATHIFWGHAAAPVHFVVTVIPPRL